MVASVILPGVVAFVMPRGMITSVVWPAIGILARRDAATVHRLGGCGGRWHPMVSMVMACGAGQIDGGPRADHYIGMTQAHHPVCDTGRGEKPRRRQGGPPGEDHPSG